MVGYNLTPTVLGDVAGMGYPTWTGGPFLEDQRVGPVWKTAGDLDHLSFHVAVIDGIELHQRTYTFESIGVAGEDLGGAILTKDWTKYFYLGNGRWLIAATGRKKADDDPFEDRLIHDRLVIIGVDEEAGVEVIDEQGLRDGNTHYEVGITFAYSRETGMVHGVTNRYNPDDQSATWGVLSIPVTQSGIGDFGEFVFEPLMDPDSPVLPDGGTIPQFFELPFFSLVGSDGGVIYGGDDEPDAVLVLPDGQVVRPAPISGVPLSYFNEESQPWWDRWWATGEYFNPAKAAVWHWNLSDPAFANIDFWEATRVGANGWHLANPPAVEWDEFEAFELPEENLQETWFEQVQAGGLTYEAKEIEIPVGPAPAYSTLQEAYNAQPGLHEFYTFSEFQAAVLASYTVEEYLSLLNVPPVEDTYILGFQTSLGPFFGLVSFTNDEEVYWPGEHTLGTTSDGRILTFHGQDGETLVAWTPVGEETISGGIDISRRRFTGT